MLSTAAGLIALLTLPIGVILSFANLVMFSDSPASTGVLGPALIVVGGLSLIVFGASKKDD